MTEEEQLDVVAWLEAESRRPWQLTIDGRLEPFPDEPNPVPKPDPTPPRTTRRRN